MNTETCDELKELAALVGGRPWGEDKGRPRIYLDSGRRDVTVYFEFPDFVPDYLGGARFVCSLKDCGQPPQWYSSQKQQIIQRHWKHGLAISAWQADGRHLAERIMRSDGSELTAAEVDLAAGFLADGQIGNAEAELAPWLDDREEEEEGLS